jgi:hypothetical protein
MANKATQFNYQGMNQDVAQSLFRSNFYFEGKNIRIVATDSQSTGAISNEKGNKFIYTIPIVTVDHTNSKITYLDEELPFTTDELDDLTGSSGPQYIIGHTTTRHYAILFTSDENGFDCIWKIDIEKPGYEITLLYLRSMGFKRDYPIQAINNFENKAIDKVYWVDGVHQMRFINIEHSIENEDLENLIDVSLTTIDMVGQYDVSQPIIVRILTGGIHTAGMIQYAYNLYRVNSSQTRLSPLSQLVSLDKDALGGGALNEVVGSTPVVSIRDIDEDYTHIKVYAIKYTSYNQSPTISIIDDREVPSSREIEVFDDGNVITSISLEEFLFLGSDILIPRHINSKDNRMFLANYEERNYDVNLDTRAYSFTAGGLSTVYDNVKLWLPGDLTPDVGGLTGDPTVVNPSTFLGPDEKNDSVNLDYSIYKFQKNGITFGGEGLYLKYELHQTTVYSADARYFKDDEIYRLGIEFVNGFGQYSLPSWVADFKAREGNLRGFYNALIFTLKPEFFVWLNDASNFETEYDKPVGYRVLIAERTVNDKTIVANGLVTPVMINDKNTKNVNLPNAADLTYLKTKADSIPKLPNILFRNIGPFFNDFSRHFGSNTRPLELSQNLQEMCNVKMSTDNEIQRANQGDDDTRGRFYQYNAMYQLYSPEIVFNESIQLSQGYQFRMKGGLENKYNAVWGKSFKENQELIDEGKGLNGLSLTYADTKVTITGNGESPTNLGLICHPAGSDPNRVAFLSWYRGYGNVSINDTFTANNYIVSFLVPFVLSTVPPSPPMPAIPPYPAEAIRFQSNNRDITFIAVDNDREFVLTYTLTPTNGAISYTAAICADSEGNNVLASFTGVGNSVVSLPIIDQPDFGGIYKEYHYYFKIVPTADMVFDVDIHAEIRDVSGSPMLVGVDSINNAISATLAAPAPPTDAFKPSTTQSVYNIYGTPELTVKGQNVTSYNGDSKYKYINTFLDIRSDKNNYYAEGGKYGRAIISGNSDNNRCITFVLDKTPTATNWYDRPLAENLFTDAAFGSGITNLGIVGEIIKPRDQIYLGNIYGGNSWEDKKRTKYIEIGDFKNFDELTPVNLIVSPGDTFVNFFKFLRVIPKTPATFSQGVPSWQEIVEFASESTVDMKNRNDASFTTWDSKFHYLDAEYHKYNKVYSQLPNLISKRELDFNVKKVDGFDTNVIASKEKSAGEIIDSWTDILQNEVLTLDGKYGAINALISFNDYLYALQDKAFAFLSINPRVQVQGQDGLAIELGTGQVLNNYSYASTNSGTLNKWGVVVAPSGVYYYDTLNQSFQVFKGGIEPLSDIKGLHTFFLNNVVANELKTDNPLLLDGISSGYDYINDDVLMTFHQPNGLDFTLSYNEKSASFVSFYDYLPTMYISKGSVLIAIDPTDLRLYRQYEGNYNEFFGTKYKSSVIFNVNPEPLLDCVFDNINFKSEVYNTFSGLDAPDKTISHIRAYNDYQDSGYEDLILGRNNNLRRKFRDWNALIPREGRNRIRAPWIKLEIDFDQTYNNPGNIDYKLILHPLNVYYTV